MGVRSKKATPQIREPARPRSFLAPRHRNVVFEQVAPVPAQRAHSATESHGGNPAPLALGLSRGFGGDGGIKPS